MGALMAAYRWSACWARGESARRERVKSEDEMVVTAHQELELEVAMRIDQEFAAQEATKVDQESAVEVGLKVDQESVVVVVTRKHQSSELEAATTLAAELEVATLASRMSRHLLAVCSCWPSFYHFSSCFGSSSSPFVPPPLLDQAYRRSLSRVRS